MCRTLRRVWDKLGIEVVLVVLAVVVLLIGGTVFSAWRAERSEDHEDD